MESELPDERPLHYESNVGERMDARARKLIRCYGLKVEEAKALVAAGLGSPKFIKKATDKQIRDAIGDPGKVRR